MALKPLPGSFFQAPLIDPKTGKAQPAFLKWLQNAEIKTGPTLTIAKDGQIQSGAVINGRTEGISTTVSNVLTDGTFNSLDNVHNGISYQRQPLYAGSSITVENGNFETSANLPPEGWIVQGSAVLSYETVAPQSGLRSLIVTPTTALDGAISTRRWGCNPNDTFRISGYVFQSNALDAEIQIVFFDKNGNLLSQINAASVTTAAWAFCFATGIAPANSVYLRVAMIQSAATTRVVKFDSIQASRILTSFELTPINTAGTPTTTSGLCSQSGISTTINVASSTMQFGDGTVAYSSGSVNPGSLGLWYVYADDPGYAGGSVTYVATATPSTCNAANGRILFGKITTVGGGGATSTGGGTGGGGPVGKAALQ